MKIVLQKGDRRERDRYFIWPWDMARLRLAGYKWENDKLVCYRPDLSKIEIVDLKYKRLFRPSFILRYSGVYRSDYYEEVE